MRDNVFFILVSIVVLLFITIMIISFRTVLIGNELKALEILFIEG
jgi:hypothetical protein